MSNPDQSNMATSPQGNNILIQLTLDKLKNFDSSNVGFWFDKIYDGLKGANIANEQMYEIIYAAIPESGQRQIKIEAGEVKDLTTLKKKIKNIFDPNPSTKAKAYISNKSLGGKSASLYVEELIEALGTNSTMLAICFLNVVPDKIEEMVKNKLLLQEDIREIASYVDSYINTYLKDEQPLYEIKNYKSEQKLSNELTNYEMEIKITVDFLRKELENQRKINDELSYEIRKLKSEMPLINSMRNFDISGRNDNSYEHRPRSYSREKYNNNGRFQRDFSRQRYENTESICYGHRKFGEKCYKEKCPQWCKYKMRGTDRDAQNKMCYGHKKYGNNCYTETCPLWCSKNNSSKNSREVPARTQ